MLKNSLFQPSLSFCFNASFFFSSLLVSASLLLQPSFSFQFRRSPFCFSVPHFSPALTFFFSFGCPLFFSPKYFFLAQTFFSFSTQTFFSFSAQTFLLQFSHSSLLLFSALFFFCSTLFFLFQRLLFFFSLASFIQGPIFSLAASHLFYLNKSLFSSNLE